MHFQDLVSPDASWLPMIGAFVILGVITHHTIRPFEIDSKAWNILAGYVLSCLSLLCANLRLGQLSFSQSLVATIVATWSFNLGLASSILLYRAFFHRLHGFPGPFGAKLSRSYALTRAAQTLQANVETQKLHEKYGDFVRVGPREISINRPSAITAIYGPTTKCTRSPWYSQVSDDVSKISINSTRDTKQHRRRKRAWDRGLGAKALASYEPRINAKVDLLLSLIAKSDGKPVNITAYCMFFGFDVMGEIGFSKDFQMLKLATEHSAIRGLHDNMAAVGILGTMPWLMSMLSKIPGATGTYQRFTDWCGKELKTKRAIVDADMAAGQDTEMRDVMSWLIKAADEGDGSAPPGEGAFQEDSRLMIIAGSDTTSVAFTNALYFLARHPEPQQTLREALLAEMPRGDADWTYEKAKRVPYLDWVIQETLRLKPSIPAGLPRLTPAEGLQVDEVFIPGDAIVSAPTYTLQRDARYWGADALAFAPARWEAVSSADSPAAEQQQEVVLPWFPFTRGLGSCPGRDLAFLELRVGLSRLLLNYDVGCDSEENMRHFDVNAKDTFTLNVPSLHLTFSKRS
ncbi:cytochrome P450 [Xylariaceae sp. FL0804]|nr:cytochrome P450 [Xylariaceae sp. FL0804]